MARVTEKNEKEKIYAILQGMPQKELDLLEGMIENAAFMRVKLKELRADINKNGMFEDFQQSEKVPAYVRERPQDKQYIAFAKSYRDTIATLLERCPPTKRASKLAELMRDV